MKCISSLCKALGLDFLGVQQVNIKVYIGAVWEACKESLLYFFGMYQLWYVAPKQCIVRFMKYDKYVVLIQC